MKNQTTQSIIVSVLIIFTVITGFNFFVKYTNADILPKVNQPKEYKYLEKLPDASGNPQETFVFNDNSINNYINTLIRLAIGIGGVLAVVRIVMGGIEYMGNEVISNKESGRDKINNAILGLILVLSAYVILNTINSQLISGAPKIENAEVTVTINDSVIQTAQNGKYSDGRAQNSPIPPHNSNLPSYVTLNHGGVECTTVGQDNCSSTYQLDTSALDKIHSALIKNGCQNTNCNFQITGGTETWLHGWGTTHRPNSGTIDLHPTNDLNRLFSGSSTPKSGVWYTVSGVGYALFEGDHWHFNPVSKN